MHLRQQRRRTIAQRPARASRAAHVARAERVVEVRALHGAGRRGGPDRPAAPGREELPRGSQDPSGGAAAAPARVALLRGERRATRERLSAARPGRAAAPAPPLLGALHAQLPHLPLQPRGARRLRPARLVRRRDVPREREQRRADLPRGCQHRTTPPPHDPALTARPSAGAAGARLRGGGVEVAGAVCGDLREQLVRRDGRDMSN